jgi:outer membrane immunogenic protein
MFRRSTVRLTAGWVLTAVLFCDAGASAGQPETDQVLQKIAALEARVAALETKNSEYKREAEDSRAQVRAANDKIFRLSNAAAIPNKAASAMVYKAYPADPMPSGWAGAYWGASAGGAATRSRVTSAERETNAFVANPSPFNLSGIDILGTSGPNRGSGGLIDLYAGLNVQLSNVVVGGQLEATASSANFSSAGSKAYTYFDANGPTGQTAVGDFRPQVGLRWMTSALLRAGILLNDQTLVYAVGGWTLAQFEARNATDNPFYQPVETFWANGWTAGAGIERKLDSNWSVRAEYRYTGFGTARTNDHFNFQITSGPFLVTEASQRQTQFDQSMQSGRIGFAYAFNPIR